LNGCKIIFLLAYSPDFNPIEKFWVNMKRGIKDRIPDFDQLYDAVRDFFLSLLMLGDLLYMGTALQYKNN
jgi:transposase